MTKKEILLTISENSDCNSDILCGHCPVSRVCNAYEMGNGHSKRLGEVIADEAQRQLDEIELDKQIEEFLSD